VLSIVEVGGQKYFLLTSLFLILLYVKTKFMKRFLFLVVFGLLFTATANTQTIAAGGFSTSVVCEDGSIMSWGYNLDGQLGDGTTAHKYTPVITSGLSDVVKTYNGWSHSHFLKSDGTVWACGENYACSLGDGTSSQRETPVQIPSLSNVIDIASGTHFTLFLKSDGTVWATGLNDYGQFGTGDKSQRCTPTQISGLTDIVDIAAGRWHSLFLKADGTVFASGLNSVGQLGDGTNFDKVSPVIIPSLPRIVSIACGDSFSVFLSSSGMVYSCGGNSGGELGDGSTESKNTPTLVNIINVVKIATGRNHALYLKNDSTVYTCGYNIYGQLGDGSNTSKSSPVKVLSLDGITDIEGGHYHSIFLKKDSTLWVSGYNAYGQLGDGTTTNSLIPIQVLSLCKVLPSSPFREIKGLLGSTYNDINENCVQDSQPGLNKRKAVIQPGDIVVETNNFGYWYLDSLSVGTYTITIDTTGKWRPTCGITQNFTVTDPNGLTQVPSFGLVSTQPCSEPTISINMPFMRPGFSNQYVYVQACNDYIATGALNSAYVDVALDELITVNSASISYTDLGDNSFRFDVGTLNPGQCVSFDMSTTVSASAVLGQTLCMEALLYPVENCVLDTIPTPTPPDFTPCTLPWDNSSILVEGECVGDSIVFTITNTGDPVDGDMDCFSPVRLYIDGEYIWLDSIQLAGGETFTYTFSGDGRTWRLEVDQHPLHPGNSHPNATIELCGDPTNWTPDLVNILPHDDEDPIKDIYCGIVTGSYDPNDKTGYPLGVGEDHLIEPNRKMEYVIRFQNTGTDTAFTVKILDTLDTDLDIFSVRSGVSSHNYHFRMHGPRVLEWTFYDIQLPDSTTNEPASHGFVAFTAKQNKDLADGTEINNRVGIYFDYNDPIITNTTSHIIGRSIKTPPPPLSVKDTSPSLSMTRIYPNPNTGSFTVAFSTQLNNANVSVKDILGKTVYTTIVSGDKHNIQLNEAKGIYFVNIQTEQGERITLKLVVE
jgi:alpha-tubulin suppressor-like RCC1 family protein